MKTQQKNKTEWKEVELKEICNIITDGTHEKTPLVSKELGFPLVTSKDLIEQGISFDNVLYITPEQHKQIIKRSKPEKGDILYSKIGTIGKPTIVNVDFEFSIKNVALFKLKKDMIISKYLVYFLKSPKIHKSLNESAGGGNQKFIPLNKLKKVMVKIPFKDGKPDLATQKQIVAILEKAEKLKQKQKKQLELYDEYLKSVFYEMFLKEKGKWEEIELQSVAKLINGRAYKQNELLKKGPMPILRVGNFFSNNKWYYSDLELDKDKYCEKGDLLYAWSASFGPKIWEGPKAIYHYHIWKVELSNKVNKIYMLHLLQAKTEEIKSSGHGISMIHVTKSGMEKLKIPLPPLKLQKKFASIVEKFEKLKEKQKKSLADSEELFNALMQKAFRGELV